MTSLVRRARVDLRVLQPGAGTARPGDGLLLHELGPQSQLLLEEHVVVLEGEAEQGEGLGEGAASQDHLGATAGERVDGREALVGAHRVVGAEHRDGARETDALGAGGDPGEQGLRGGDRIVVAVVLADGEDVDPRLISDHALLEHAAQRLGVAHALALPIDHDVAEGVDPERDPIHAVHVRLSLSRGGRADLSRARRSCVMGPLFRQLVDSSTIHRCRRNLPDAPMSRAPHRMRTRSRGHRGDRYASAWAPIV
jgi:hypothetical protein